MASHKIRTTMQPTVEIEVSDAELLDLERLGLVLKTRASSDSGLQRAAQRQTESKDS